MRSAFEDSPPDAAASNQDRASALRRLAEACRAAAAAAAAGRQPLDAVLASALEATHAERAFLVRAARDSTGPTHSVVAAFRRRTDGPTGASRTVLRAALRTSRVLVSVDAGDDTRLRAGASVRELELRTVLAAPLTAADGARAALVLDSRGAPAPMLPRQLGDTVAAYAALAALLLAGPRPAPVGADAAPDEPSIVGVSAAVRRMLDWADRVAATELPVVVHGETGCGKEAVARRIHRRSRRRDGPFLALNCTALPESLFEAELFGAARGAYTGADRDRPGLFGLAGGGTLFLDEIGDMPRSMQAKLLRALQERRVRPVGGAAETPIDVRVVAATHRNLAELVGRGEFRADLFHRLAVLVVAVPALRERLEDLPLLVADLGDRLARETGLGPPRLADDAWAALAGHSWPGNVRELHAVLARALLLARGEPIGTGHLSGLVAPPPVAACDPTVTAEGAMIAHALELERGSLTRAARRIGWTRQKLSRRIAALGIRRAGARPEGG